MYKCYLNKFLTITDPFLQISNYTDLQIYFILQYNTQRGHKTRKSPILGRGVSKKLSFTKNATDIAFNVINASSPSQYLICNRVLTVPIFSYFNVIETPTGIQCIQD